MHTCKKLEPGGQFKSQTSNFQPQFQLEANQPDYVNADDAKRLKIYTYAVR
jgi:hypothetical protein